MSGVPAVVVLPEGALGRVADAAQKRWLSRGTVTLQAPQTEMLATVLAVLKAPIPDGGMAALRFWGQTGERSGSWIAAADPVHLEARMRDVRIRFLGSEDVTSIELGKLFDTLQVELGNDAPYSFARLGAYGYLHCEEPMELPSVSASIANGHVPDKFTPSGDNARRYHQLLGELQMLLHDHDVNRQRQDSGSPAVNSLWFWGGGVAPQQTAMRLPDLHSNDPLFAGYWASCNGNISSWQDLDACTASSPLGFVAVTPLGSSDMLAAYLDRIANQLKTGKLKRVTLLFRDGLSVVLEKSAWLRFWRGTSPQLEAPM